MGNRISPVLGGKTCDCPQQLAALSGLVVRTEKQLLRADGSSLAMSRSLSGDARQFTASVAGGGNASESRSGMSGRARLDTICWRS